MIRVVGPGVAPLELPGGECVRLVLEGAAEFTYQAEAIRVRVGGDGMPAEVVITSPDCMRRITITEQPRPPGDESLVAGRSPAGPPRPASRPPAISDAALAMLPPGAVVLWPDQEAGDWCAVDTPSLGRSRGDDILGALLGLEGAVREVNRG